MMKRMAGRAITDMRGTGVAVTATIAARAAGPARRPLRFEPKA